MTERAVGEQIWQHIEQNMSSMNTIELEQCRLELQHAKAPHVQAVTLGTNILWNLAAIRLLDAMDTAVSLEIAYRAAKLDALPSSAVPN